MWEVRVQAGGLGLFAQGAHRQTGSCVEAVSPGQRLSKGPVQSPVTECVNSRATSGAWKRTLMIKGQMEDTGPSAQK